MEQQYGPIHNAIVCMFDSWQFNYNGCYGNDWIKTPNFDRFAREGVLFENAYAEGVPTIPVRRALHTGRFTLHEIGWAPLRASDTTIADMCWGQGIDTALIFDCPMYRLPKYGFTRGFDKVYFLHGHEADHDFYQRFPLYHHNPKDFVTKHQLEKADEVIGGPVMEPLLHEIEAYLKHRQFWKSEEDQNAPRVMKKAVQYLEDVDRNLPFFLWIDNFDPHEPWDPPSVYDADKSCPYNPNYKGPDLFVPIMDSVKGLYTEEELHHVRMLYAEKVTMCDTWFGYLLENIRRLGLEENTMVIAISDHGEPMGNGEHGHGIMRKCRPWPYEELVHIPLLIRAPGLPAGTRVQSMVQNLDITPTITNWIGLHGVATHMHGIDLWPLMTGKVKKIRDFAIAGYNGSSWAMYTEDWAFIHWLHDSRVVKSSAYLLAGHTAGGSINKETGEDDMAFLKSLASPIVRKDELEEFKEYQKTMTLDGADQWTCTPGAKREVPEGDELYDRRTDPFQLQNVIKKHPDIAQKMMDTLDAFMAERMQN